MPVRFLSRLFAPITLVSQTQLVQRRRHHLFGLLHQQAELSWSYLMLLVGSLVISTLGLLISSPPVVIGGMIIAPLIWPMAKLSSALLLSKRDDVIEALVVVLISIGVGIATAVVITTLSPIKFLNEEILTRTNPTLIDVFIALAAGTVAAFAMTHRKVSESLAGVAVATSLVPPLSVSGIGLALGKLDIFWGAFVLFSTNVVSMVLAIVVVFAGLGIRKQRLKGWSWLGLVAVVGALVMLSVPLAESLLTTVSQRATYQQVRTTLLEQLAEISDQIELQSVRTEQSEEVLGRLEVEAEIFLPETMSFTFEEREHLISSLEEATQSQIDLALKLQPIVEVQSVENTLIAQQSQRLRRTLSDRLAADFPEVIVQSIEVDPQPVAGTWSVVVMAVGDPDLQLTESDRQLLEEALSIEAASTVELSIQLIPLLELVSEPEIEQQAIRQETVQLIESLFEAAQLPVPSTITVHIHEESLGIRLELLVDQELPADLVQNVQRYLDTSHQLDQSVQIEVVRVERI